MVVFAFTAALLPPSLAGRRRPRPRRAASAPRIEQINSCVNLATMHLADVIRLYGKPDRVENHRVTFIWRLDDVRVTVTLMGGGGINAVEVTGPRPLGPIGRTGRGLALGDDLARFNEMYGGSRSDCAGQVGAVCDHTLFAAYPVSGQPVAVNVANGKVVAITVVNENTPIP